MNIQKKIPTHKSAAMTLCYANLWDAALTRAAGLAGEIIGSALDEWDKDKKEPGKKILLTVDDTNE